MIQWLLTVPCLLLGWSLVHADVELPDAELLQNITARNSLSLDGDWHVIPDPYENGYFNHRYEVKDDGYFLALPHDDPTQLIEYDFRRSPTLKVPGDWNSQEERYFLYEGTMWYFHAFDFRPVDNHTYVLHFGAANYNAKVWMNGKYLGEHEGGFTPFEFSADEALLPGENVIVVKVDNKRGKDQVPTVNTDWWNYGGITRSVSLIALPLGHIADYRVSLVAPGRIGGWVRVSATGPGQPVRIAIPELGIDESLSVDAKGIAEFGVAANPDLWSPESPKLYNLQVSTGNDTVSDKIGFRTIATDGKNILLNGAPVFLRGISLHEVAPDREGRAWSMADAREMLGRALALDCNFVRLAHYPHNENMLRAADELGLLVWAEIPVYWTIDFQSETVYAKAQQQLDEMIARDANRASIILWSMANETPLGQARYDFIAKLAAHARRLDGSRLITAALDTQTADSGVRVVDDPLAKVIDVIGVNSYCGWYGDKPADCASIRWRVDYDKPVVMSEFGAGALEGMHGNPAHRWTEEYQADVYVQNLRMIDNFTALRGISPWILQDFRSPRRALPGIQDFWNRKGLLSETGEKKEAWYVLKDYYRARIDALR